MTTARAAAVGLALVLGCSAKPAGPDASATPPVTEKELARGREICAKYVARACACGDAGCELAKSQPDALELQAKLLAGANGKLNGREKEITEVNLRKVIAACVQADGLLDPKTCPRQ